MRPVHLTMEGFGAYRDKAEVDFRGADLFALTGPTGAGKSTVVDAICFALYGSVPRYQDQKLLVPAITQGAPQARVSFDFTVGDEAYRVFRLVRRTASGANTKEARLERLGDGAVLAGVKKEVDAAVEELLGLSYDQFTKCVVLPQGEFARFLHDKPDDRQSMLVRLLDLGLYKRMADVAHQRDVAAEREVVSLDEQLAGLGDATVQARDAAATRVAVLDKLHRTVEERLEAAAAAMARVQEARTRAEQAAQVARTLQQVRPPAGLADLAASQLATAAARRDAEAAETAAQAAVQQAEAQVAAFGSRGPWERALEWLAELEKQQGRRAKGEPMVARAAEAQDAARQELAAAEAALEAAQVADLAGQVRIHLLAGEPCPVCEQTVVTLPAGGGPPAAVEHARQHRIRCAKDLEAATGEAEKVRATLATVLERIAELETALASGPAVAEAEAALEAIDAAARAAEAARTADRNARSGAQQARQAATAAEQSATAARDDLLRTATTLTPLGAPMPVGDDLMTGWADLTAWAAAAAPQHHEAAQAAQSDAAAAEAEATAIHAELVERCRSEGIEPGRDLRDTVVAAHTRAESDLQRIEAALARVGELHQRRAQAAQRQEVARALHKHLGTKGFERWVLDEALDHLVAGASETMKTLSSGQYSLAMSDKDFAVIDHRDADQQRRARTLSGGETFLASLALALALADQLALLWGRGSARLDSLFLDEGFGTLDPDTLDTVAAAIEELGARGRTVGLISHVPELAERVPVRFEVAKHANAATITRVDR